jgi:hypothetical protein
MFEEVAEAQGWTEATQVSVLLDYINNQQSDEAFIDYILELQGQENNLDVSNLVADALKVGPSDD